MRDPTPVFLITSHRIPGDAQGWGRQGHAKSRAGGSFHYPLARIIHEATAKDYVEGSRCALRMLVKLKRGHSNGCSAGTTNLGRVGRHYL